jgi:hypothetical protein
MTVRGIRCHLIKLIKAQDCGRGQLILISLLPESASPPFPVRRITLYGLT